MTCISFSACPAPDEDQEFIRWHKHKKLWSISQLLEQTDIAAERGMIIGELVQQARERGVRFCGDADLFGVMNEAARIDDFIDVARDNPFNMPFVLFPGELESLSFPALFSSCVSWAYAEVRSNGMPYEAPFYFAVET
jgi:hypothetical protein